MQKQYLALSVVLLTVGIGTMVFFFRSQPAPKPVPSDPDDSLASGPTDAELVELKRLANTALGRLENEELADAAESFLALSEALPDDPLPARNLAVARYMAYEQGTATREETEQAIDQLLKVERLSAPGWWLRGKVALKAAAEASGSEQAATEQRAAVSAFATAADVDPKSVVYPFELYEAAKNAPGQAEQERGLAALAAAYQMAPENLFVLSEWLLALATRQDPEIISVLENAKQTIAPLQARIQATTRADILELTDRAIQAAREGNWNAVLLNVRIVFINLIRPQDIAQSDKRQLLPHPLEFTLARLDDKLEVQLDNAHRDMVPTVEFSFQPLDIDAAVPADLVSVLLVDADLDGRLDVALLSSQQLQIWSPREAGWQRLSSVALPAGSRGVLAADLDHDRDRQLAAGPDQQVCFDADADFVVYGDAGLTVLRNDRSADDGARSLQQVDPTTPLELPGVTTALLVDFDHDSDLDLVAATAGGMRVLLNEGQLNFADVTQYSQLPPSGVSVTDLAMVDWDRDVDIDILLATPGSGEAGYLENLRHGNFRWVAFDQAFATLTADSALEVLESDGNASWDLCGTGFSGTQVLQSATVPGEGVRWIETRRLGNTPHRDLLVADLDNDGRPDALCWGEAPVDLYRGLDEGKFTNSIAATAFAEPPTGLAACDVGDLDADGDLDLAAISGGKLLLFSNEGGNKNMWLQVRAMGQVDNKGKANHHGLGSLLELRTAGRYQAQVVTRPVTHFGLGQQPADMLRFLWTNGVPQAIVQPEANQIVCEPMILKGSCPYLYAWNGSRYEFVTDLLWAAPIGLQVAEGQLAPARPWEYLLVRGDQLQPRDGVYPLSITEELWEAAYFDQVQLLAIDHPADVQVYSNEKVGPASMAEFQVHTVRQPRVPLAARDPQGNDVLPAVRDADGQFYAGFNRRFLPGLVEEHYLELDLGALERPQQIRLFLTGWIYPTDTSLNISLSQDPHLDAPQPPSLWVPDTDGSWRQVMPFMGFPGGKTKTIVIDLSNVFVTDDYRLRIVTTAEIYWDQAFFTVDEEPVEVRVEPLTLRSARLRFRGVSQPHPARPHTPETYDYSRVLNTPKWPPMRGAFTRYGDVADLLRETDDRLVVLGSGDEMLIEFDAPPPPPQGWRRDFFLHNVGWDKDADPNTVYGQTVEPLPFVGMERYPYVEQSYPSSPLHREYLKQYQTRTAPLAPFWRP